MKNRNQGITLIALIITIIILLILAGIAITTLAGDNGILNKANNAKTKNEEVQQKEQIEMAIMCARMNESNYINLDELESELLKVEGIENENIEKQGDDGRLPWLVSTDHLQYQILENGKVEVIKNGIVLSKTQIKLQVGETESLTVSFIGNKSSNVDWYCSDSNVIDLDKGKITAKEIGTSTITATTTLEGEICSKECKVTVISHEDWLAGKIEEIVAENYDINTDDYNREKIREEISKLDQFREIINIGNDDFFPWMIDIEDIGYSLGDDGKVTVTKGLWGSSKYVEIMEGDTAQIQVRYFNGDPNSDPNLYPIGMGSTVDVTDDFIITPLIQDYNTGFYVFAKWPATGRIVGEIYIQVHSIARRIDIFKEAKTSKKIIGERNGWTLTEGTNCELSWKDYYLIGIGHSTDRADYDGTIDLDWDKVKKKTELIPEKAFFGFSAPGRCGSYSNSSARVEIYYKDGSKQRASKDIFISSYNGTDEVEITFLNKEIEKIHISLWRT